jgi:outer membrane protein
MQKMRKLMKFKYLAICVAVLLPLTSHSESLLEVYQQALQSDPLIHEADAMRMAASEAAPQARGVLFPQIEATAAYSSNESTGNRFTTQFDQNTGQLLSGSVPFDSSSDNEFWDIQLRQTIFRWDQVVGLQQAGKVVARAEADYEAAQQDLMIRVATRYFEVLAAEDILTSIHADRLAIARQLEQATQRFEVGLIAITDVQESQAAYDQSVADEIGAKRSLATAREFLREITGEYVTSLSAPGEDFPLISPSPSDETSWIDLAMAQNLSVVSSRLGEQIARDEISFRRTGHYPTLDLVVGRQSNDTTGEFGSVDLSGTRASGPLDSNSVDDSIFLQFRLPIFSGGTTSSRVREAVYLHRASSEQLQRVARATERQTRDAYLGVLAEIIVVMRSS